jgi:hypothetical protein
MRAKALQFGVAFLLALSVAGGACLIAQEPAKTKDDALDSLFEKLAESGDSSPPKSGKAKQATQPRRAAKTGAGRSSEEPKSSRGWTAKGQKSGEPPRDKVGKPSAKPRTVAPKDQAIDDLLEKLGETKDAPAPEERPHDAAGEPPKEPSPGEKPKGAKLGGKDKEIDDRLEEYAGRKKKRRPPEEQAGGPMGEIIKEMRDVEQRLGKPDPSEGTQNKQKRIVQRIDTLIEQVRRSGASGGRMTLRRVRRSGQQQGQQPGDQTGAMARGAPATKPAKPTGQHSTAGGRDIWGHLPPELREVMENSFKEAELASKAEMISRYFLSIAKGKPRREE